MSDAAHQACPICGTEMFGAHCKLICRNCGYREDCSDLFPPEHTDHEGSSCRRESHSEAERDA
jgi:hypothetical protein